MIYNDGFSELKFRCLVCKLQDLKPGDVVVAEEGGLITMWYTTTEFVIIKSVGEGIVRGEYANGDPFRYNFHPETKKRFIIKSTSPEPGDPAWGEAAW